MKSTKPTLAISNNVITFLGSNGDACKVYKYNESTGEFESADSFTVHASNGVSSHVQMHSGGTSV